MNNPRQPEHPAQVVDCSIDVPFLFNGKALNGNKGDTVASALFANEVRIFSRSFKYHRPRGLLCVSGKCPNCMMTVDGEPNVRACTRLLQDGMKVKHQNAWPSLKFDIASILDKLDIFLPVGFYYKSFIHPKFIWRFASKIIRRMAGLGTLDLHRESKGHYQHYNRHTDVAVIGGGPAGITSAIEAARTGVSVTLIDDQPRLGGHLRSDVHSYSGNSSDYSGMNGYEVADSLVEKLGECPNVETLSEASAFGLYEGNLVAVIQYDRVVKLRAKRVIVASGCNEVPFVFQGNDLPGVTLSTGIQKLIHLYGLKPGSKAVVVTNNEQGYKTAVDLIGSGMRVEAIADARSEGLQDSSEIQFLKSLDVPILNTCTIKEAKGKQHVNGAVLTGIEGGTEKNVECDLICIAMGFDPALSLLYQAGCGATYDEELNETVPSQMLPTIYAAGDVQGIHDLDVIMLQGKIAGTEAAASLLDAGELAKLTQTDRELLANIEKIYREKLHIRPVWTSPNTAKKKFVCVCEDITEKDVLDAIGEGFDDIQTLKRYSTVSMGPCQGRMCLKTCIGIFHQKMGISIDEAGTTTSRPPFSPIPLGALAGPAHMPIKLTPLDKKHREMGALMMDVGPWKRPHSYAPPQEECQAVRQRVGMIDVSTLGKLEVQGQDAPALLDKVYTHNFSNLGVGRIRYGLLCSDSGIIIDDGTITRLAEDRYFITTTTGNLDLMEEWLKWWSAGQKMCVHTANVTSAFAAINVAGPKARNTLSKLTDIDLSPTAFRYMRSVTGEMAGVPCILLRIGFVGESGWEIHFPAEYAEYMWDTLMESGQEFGIAPFAVESQRILRLEKKHIIIGQDTDVVSNPLEADMSWVVRFEKEDFIGKHALGDIQERGLRDKLIGFVMDGGVVPEDGLPVVANGIPVGRVTSSRLSPTLQKGFGLAWVPAELAEAGNKIHIQISKKLYAATVWDKPFYDPDGIRLRE